ncbi:MAG: hypothetical protein ACM3PW_09455 [Chlamydiota bacterium]
MRVSRLFIAVLVIIFLFPGLQVRAQDSSTPPINAGPQFPQTPSAGQRQPSEAERKMEHEQQKKLNQERQAELKRDTDKLLQLATQLKHEVDKSNENTLSLEVMRKAGEIEKLAKSVREKMRGWN